jgi:hypothetical protein
MLGSSGWRIRRTGCATTPSSQTAEAASRSASLGAQLAHVQPHLANLAPAILRALGESRIKALLELQISLSDEHRLAPSGALQQLAPLHARLELQRKLERANVGRGHLQRHTLDPAAHIVAQLARGCIAAPVADRVQRANDDHAVGHRFCCHGLLL